MAKFEIKLPKMGESVAEATITAWLKEVGDTIELDEAIVEIATDKVDSEVPSEVAGTLVELKYAVDDIVAVGEVIAVIETEGENVENTPVAVQTEIETPKEATIIKKQVAESNDFSIQKTGDSGKFYSPLVRNIAKMENISMAELESINGSGKDGRVTKDDLLNYIKEGKKQPSSSQPSVSNAQASTTNKQQANKQQTSNNKQQTKPSLPLQEGDEVIAMTRMGKMIAHHMVASVQTSAHVQSFVEVDVTNVVKWRNKVKDAFFKREGEKLTFTPIFMQAIAKALKDYPMINIAVDGDNIIKRKNINLGMAAALPDGNLIVPVIKNADQLNLVGMAKQVNNLAVKARNGKLSPDDIQGGTYTVTNVGGFGSIMGTPIINQPQVGILALGAIRKTPAVIETNEGDYIGIRHKMFLSHSYDHRVVNGALGGMFVKKVSDYLEAWDVNMDF
ncbi:MAG TPA: 2-oxo acid dehydrogenase subunit E2, partial [Flavobacteriaceae bacterium]|nr:2-oxo acid dehydrogenase subunit E2 [Flavobacteriaceae bacterium]